MASDTGDSRRKHRRSSDDDETEKASKRHKHRHHHRHHRHRHSSKKRDKESKIDCEEAAPPSIHQPPVVQNGSRPDDDVEEGEILDEEGAGGCDLESEHGSHEQIPGECGEDDLTVGELDHKLTRPVEERIKRSHSSLKTLKEDWIDNDLTTNLTSTKEDKANGKHNFANKMHGEVGSQRHLSAEHEDGSISGGSPRDYVNGDIGHKSYKIENSQKMESDSLSRGSGRGKEYSDVDHVEAKTSSYRDRYHEGNAVPRSRSQERARERSRSQSVVEEEALQKRRRDIDRNSSYHDSDDGRMSRRSGDRLPGSRDLVADEDREHSTRGQSRETWEKDRSRDNGSDRDHRRDAELGRSRDMDHRTERERERSRDSDHRRDMERERSRDRDHRREMERERSRDIDHRREMERERSRDRDHRREMERERSRDIDHRREMERERSRDRDHRREMERERSRDRLLEKERKWDYERHRSKDREDDRDRRREKERDRKDRDVDRVRDRKWESERDRRTDREKYKHFDDDCLDRDRHRDSRLSRHDEGEYQRDRTRKSDSAQLHSSKSDSLEEGEEKQKRNEDEKEDYEETVPFLAEQEEEDLNRIKEESRRRMQAILEKYKSKPSQQKTEPQSDEAEKDKVPTEHSSQPIDAGNAVPEISDDKSNGVDTHGADPQFSVGKSPPQNGISVSERTTGAGGLGEGSPKSERSTDMFCDDIFGESPAGVRKSGKGDGLHIERSGFHDNWDDADGYYSYRFGEILDGRYEVTAAHGKGVFSTVVRARDLKAGIGDPEEVAIKIIRNNDTMYKAGIEELGILKKLVGADPDDKRHCVRFLSSFKYRNHLCLVFESLHMNLREVLKKFGRNIGLKLTAVRAYAKQLFIALKHLKNCGVLHCDIKPDNMLVNEAKNVLKLCDFGNAMYAGKNEITPYLVSRFYRAPEIILGLPYDHPLDIWSVGCCLFELYTGKVLFPGHTNNDMLRLHMELKGPFPKKMLRKGGFIDQHFDQDLNFLATEDDPVTKKVIRRTLFNIKPKDIGSIISGSSGEDPKMLANFKDLLEKIFMLDPEKRMTVSQALNHPFITGK